MAEPNVYWFYNSDTGDATAHGSGAAGSAENDDWKEISVGSDGDTLVFTGPSVSDGAASNTRDTIIIPAAGDKEIDKTFIDDGSTVEQVPLAGTDQGGQSGGDTQYVFCVFFDGETASPPYLEMWDDSGHDSIALQVLGADTPDNSYVKGIVTTVAAPGMANWVASGITMAGSGSADRLDLNVGSAIGSDGKNLYWNQCIRVPSSATPFSSGPVCSLRYTYT
jgi:hypothetical protein